MGILFTLMVLSARYLMGMNNRRQCLTTFLEVSTMVVTVELVKIK